MSQFRKIKRKFTQKKKRKIISSFLGVVKVAMFDFICLLFAHFINILYQSSHCSKGRDGDHTPKTLLKNVKVKTKCVF